jgi:F0F1-type ATP synthase assembly protein I
LSNKSIKSWDHGILKRGRSSRPIFAHITMGLQLAITVLVFLIGGYKLDNRYNKSPLFVMLGAFVGMALGFYLLLKELKEMQREEKEYKERGDDKKRVRWM